MAAVSSADGRFELFVETARGIEHFWQKTMNGGVWTRYAAPYQPAPKFPSDVSAFDAASVMYRPTIVAGRDGSGCVMAAWIVNGQVYFVAAPAPGASLNEPGTLIHGTTSIHALALTINQDGRLELFTLDTNGQVRSFRQAVVGTWGWSPATSWGGAVAHPFKTISVTRHDGRVVMVGVIAKNDPGGMREGSVAMEYQTAPNGPPTGTVLPLSGEKVRYVVARESIDHRLELFAYGGDSLVYNRYEQTRGQFNLTTWEPLDTLRVAAPIHVLATGDGRMQAISLQRANRTRLRRMYQREPNGPWEQGWRSLPEGATYSPAVENDLGPVAVAIAPDGRVGLFEFRMVTEENLTFRVATPSAPHWGKRQMVQRAFRIDR